ncbi:hypothetical protein RUND412_007673 [Rhizina undulata]
MSLASRISNLFYGDSSTTESPTNAPTTTAALPHSAPSSCLPQAPPRPIGSRSHDSAIEDPNVAVNLRDLKKQEERPPYLHAMIAGGIGGSTGDVLMHSLDTVKTRQQGAPNAVKYATMSDAYRTILREEGFRRGLYGGMTPAFMGSLPATMIFFGSYEYSKRYLIDSGCPDSIAYLTAGLIGDLFASVIYVPSEVLKTRLQLQGRYNNPHFYSGYNYRGTIDATRTIIKSEGPAALFYGYKATIMRDLPFSALQFAFYEEFQKWAKIYSGTKDIGLPLEILTGAMAGGLAGTLTCPLDVVKTRIQTQVRTNPSGVATPALTSSTTPHITQARAFSTLTKMPPPKLSICAAIRAISTSSPSTTSPPKSGDVKLNTSSIFLGLKILYKNEGFAGLFRGVGPRAVWTSVQSGTMLVLYQSLLKQLDKLSNMEVDPI